MAGFSIVRSVSRSRRRRRGTDDGGATVPFFGHLCGIAPPVAFDHPRSERKQFGPPRGADAPYFWWVPGVWARQKVQAAPHYCFLVLIGRGWPPFHTVRHRSHITVPARISRPPFVRTTAHSAILEFCTPFRPQHHPANHAGRNAPAVQYLCVFRTPFAPQHPFCVRHKLLRHSISKPGSGSITEWNLASTPQCIRRLDGP